MRTHSRAGFTLVELMVAMALTLFVMVILSQAFVLALETFSGMKGIGDMQQNMRVATIILRDDLAQDHFEGKRRLSDVSASGVSQIAAQPPQAGFFAIFQRSAVTIPPATPGPYHREGFDTNNMASFRATDHVLYMTVKRKGNRQEDFFTTSLTGTPAVPTLLTQFFSAQTAYNVPAFPLSNMADATLTVPYGGVSPGFYSSQWAEVIYYLKRTGSTEEPNNQFSTIGTPTFELFRAQFVMVPDGTQLRTPVPATPGPANLFAPNYPPAIAANERTRFDSWIQTSFGQMSCRVANVGVGGPQFQLWFMSPMDAAQGSRILYNAGTPLDVPLLVRPGGLPGFNPQVGPQGPPNVFASRVALSETPVLPNVISFQIQIMPTGWSAETSYVTGTMVTHNGNTYRATINHTNVLPGAGSNPWQLVTQAPFSDLVSTGVSGRLYDTTLFTAAPATYGNRAGIKAVQITLRVFDPKTRQTRQVTIVQDM